MEAQMARELANWIVYGFSDTICAPLRKHIYCNVQSTIGRSSDFDRQVCRGLDVIKKREKKIGEVKKKDWVLKKQSRELKRSVFLWPGALNIVPFHRYKVHVYRYNRGTYYLAFFPIYLYIICSEDVHRLYNYIIVTRSYRCQETRRKLIVKFVFL